MLKCFLADILGTIILLDSYRCLSAIGSQVLRSFVSNCFVKIVSPFAETPLVCCLWLLFFLYTEKHLKLSSVCSFQPWSNETLQTLPSTVMCWKTTIASFASRLVHSTFLIVSRHLIRGKTVS